MQDVILDPLHIFHCPYCGEDLLPLAPEPFTTLACTRCNAEVAVPGQFGQFLLRQRITDSVISSVFEASDPKLDRSVSLKILNFVLSKNSELAEAFKREALAAASLNSPHVLKVYEFGTHNGQPYMVMENTEGRYLNALMQERRLSDHRILHITEGIVQGLMDTHEQGIVHGDVMPRNILIDPDGTAKICDFGLARFSGQDASPIDSWSSPYYMPPERIQGLPEDHRADFYSLGTTLYMMICDHLPFFDLDEDMILKRKCEESAPDPRVHRPDATPCLCELALRLLERDPQRRPSDYSELQDLLRDAFNRLPREDNGSPRSSSATRPLQKAVLPRKQPPWVLFLLLALGLAGAWLIAHFARQRSLKTSENANPPGLFPTPLPTATPTPIPTLTPQPSPTAPPALPTPVIEAPAPPHLPVADFHGDTGSVKTDEEGFLLEWCDRRLNDPVFLAFSLEQRPRVEAGLFGQHPGIRFENSALISGRTPHTEDAFTLVFFVHPSTSSVNLSKQALAGNDPATAGEHWNIHLDPMIGDAVRFQSRQGSAILVLSREERGKPFVVAFVRGPKGDRAYVGTHSVMLAGPAPARPEPDPEALPSLHLGSLPGFTPYQGSLAEFRIYGEELSDEALQTLFLEMERRYGAAP